MLGCLLTLTVAIIAVTDRTNMNPSQIGLVLSFILVIQQILTFAVRQMAEVQNDMNSVSHLLSHSLL
jgi:ATP-binding cassette, subfamily C (CFTR/MRP), member 1